MRLGWMFVCACAVASYLTRASCRADVSALRAQAEETSAQHAQHTQSVSVQHEELTVIRLKMSEADALRKEAEEKVPSCF